MWKELAISAAAIGFINISCDNPSTPIPEAIPATVSAEKIGVENKYTWLSPGGTIFKFETIDFPGTFYPEVINKTLGKYCDKPLVVPEVNVFIGPVDGFNTKTGKIDPHGGVRAVTIMGIEKATGKPGVLQIGVAGGQFQKLRSEADWYYYTSPHLPNEKIVTNSLFDLNGSIFEEVGYHSCIATVGTELDSPNAQAESARFHKNFLKNPSVMFRPKGW